MSSSPGKVEKKRGRARSVIASSLAAVLGLGGALVASAPAHAAEVTYVHEGVTYLADDADFAAGARVTSYNPAEGNPDLVILRNVTFAEHPDVTVPVTAIWHAAFESRLLNSVVIPDSVTWIGGTRSTAVD